MSRALDWRSENLGHRLYLEEVAANCVVCERAEAGGAGLIEAEDEAPLSSAHYRGDSTRAIIFPVVR